VTDLPILLIRLENGLRTGRLDLAGEAISDLRKIGIDIRVNLWPRGEAPDRHTSPCVPSHATEAVHAG
jgi:hypothetical protein